MPMDYRAKRRVANCEECEFYVYDDEGETYYCSQNLDQDDMERYLGGNTGGCPYYRYYNEYESTRRQN